MSSEDEVKLKIDSPKNSTVDLGISQSFSEKEFKRKTYWKSCCGCSIDKRAVQFFSQLLISLIIIVFCLFQLHTLDKCDSGEYLSLLTMILGMWIDAPRLH